MPPRRKTRSTAGKSVPIPKVSPKASPPKPKSKSYSPEPASLTSPEHKTTTGSSPETTSLTAVENADSKMISDSIAEEAPVEVTLVDTTKDFSGENLSERGEKKIVKKTVRVVKKIVKKKILKKAQKGPSVVSDDDEKEKLEEAGNDGEVEVNNSHPVDFVSMEVENSNLSDMVSVEIEHSKRNTMVSMDNENPSPNPNVSVSMEVEKPSAPVDVSRDVENLKECEVSEREKGVFLVANLFEVPVVSPGVDEGETGCVTEAPLEDQNVGLRGHQIDEQNSEDVNLEKQEGEEGVKLQAEKSECSDMKIDVVLNDGIEGEERVKEQVKNSEVGNLGDKILLSGEMEALERRRRRKTEIFVGGLDTEAKEEDIRTVFEEVGEVIEVRLIMKDGKTRKNKGFAFVRYASAADAKTALVKYHKVEICGRQCGTAPVEGNDTIFLGNIDKKWKDEDVLKLLQKIGIEKIDKVSVVADPSNIELNRGFAFVELETKKDAQTAYSKLQKKDVFGKHLKIKVAWAEPLIEPDEEEMRKVKSVYAEYIPSSWDEEKVKDYFKRFGEIETVALARNLHSSKRKDFAFINYKSREAALACIEAFSHEQFTDEGTKVNVKVSLAKSLTKGKHIKPIPKPLSMELSKASQTVLKPQVLRNMGKSKRTNHEDARFDRRSSTTAELLQLLREQASWSQARPGSSIVAGTVDREYLHPSPGKKRPFPALGNDPFYSDPRGYSRARVESPCAITHPRSLSQGVLMTPLPNYNQQGSLYTVEADPRYFQTRERVPYHGSSSAYRGY